MTNEKYGAFDYLFSLELNYRGPVELAPIGGKNATLIGGGDGTVDGPSICGTVRWSNYETTGDDMVCDLQVPGIIETQDGAEIRFEGREYAMPLANGRKQWKIVGVMRFKTDDQRYQWLNETFAVTSGAFDYDTGRARWQAYIPSGAAPIP
ncbi:MAG: DUF3237 family protein [Rhizobiales bacterium]|nr:DUF3237 family protein [Hyphomicrobiales bacterium]